MIGRMLNSLHFMRDHRWTRSHMSEFIDLELDEPERRRVEEHVGLCPQCHRLLRTLRRTVSGLRSLDEHPSVPPADGVTENVLSRFRDEG